MSRALITPRRSSVSSSSGGTARSILSAMARRGARSAAQGATSYAKRKASEYFNKASNKRPKRSATLYRSGGDQGGGAGASVRKGFKKSVNVQKKRRVSVSPKFRKGVQQVMEEKMPRGTYMKTGMMGNIQVPTNNKQNITVFMPTSSGVIFSPQQYLDAVSVLWNGKTATANSAFGDTNNFNPYTTKINVINSSCTIRFRNNSQRTMMVDLVEARSKNQKVAYNPIGQWSTCLSTDIGIGAAVGMAATDYEIMYNKPQYTSDYNKYYTEAVTKVTLEPGQVYTWFIQGPNQKIVNMAKYLDGGVGSAQYQIYNTLARFIYARVHTDLVGDTLNATGRALQNAAGHGIIAETTLNYSVECPRETGVLNVKDAYKVIDFYPTLGTIHRVDEQNPQTEETAPQ